MDEDKGVAPVESAAPQTYQDRSTGLMIFGILTLLIGCLCGVFVPLMLIGLMSAPAGSPQTSLSAILPGMLVYGVLAVALVWLGIGSITAKRWARALLLIFSWSWLVTGVIVSIVMIIVLPRTIAHVTSDASGNNPMPPGAKAVMILTMAIIFGGIFILLPAVWTFFYSSRHVKATCEARDPVMRWTDACPLPVLGLAVWLAFSAPMLLISAVAGHGVTPFFGMFLTGIAGAMLLLLMAVLWVYAAWSLYKLKPIGWWIVFVALCLLMASTFITFRGHDTLEMYRLMGYSEWQIAEIEETGLATGNYFVWLCVISMLPFLCYLFFVRRYIFRKIETASPVGA